MSKALLLPYFVLHQPSAVRLKTIYSNLNVFVLQFFCSNSIASTSLIRSSIPRARFYSRAWLFHVSERPPILLTRENEACGAIGLIIYAQGDCNLWRPLFYFSVVRLLETADVERKGRGKNAKATCISSSGRLPSLWPVPKLE